MIINNVQIWTGDEVFSHDPQQLRIGPLITLMLIAGPLSSTPAQHHSLHACKIHVKFWPTVTIRVQ